MQSKFIYITTLVITVLFVCLCPGCKKLVKVDVPNTSINSENVFNNEATAIAAVTGIFSTMSNNFIRSQISFPPSFSFFLGLSADELSLFQGISNEATIQYYRNDIDANTINVVSFWNTIYPIIYLCNDAVQGISNSTSLITSVRDQLLGEAKLCRSFCYFYLVSLYGDVPLITTTDWKINSTLSRTASKEVWQQIKLDLEDAKSLLSPNYLDATLLNTSTNRIRPTKWSAAALLARAYLYTEDWDKAEITSSSIINNTTLYGLDSLNRVFLANSKEAVWQWPRTLFGGMNPPEAQLFIMPDSGPSQDFPLFLNSFLLSAFESGDKRKNIWIDSVKNVSLTKPYYYPFKYKIADPNADPMEYTTVFRLAEQYLIRAEARAQKGNINGSQSDLNVIRNRAGLPNTTSNDKPSLLTAILHERQVELFTEWGHRWLDLKRTKTIDAIMSVVTPLKSNGNVIWKSYQQLYPIPESELQKTPQMEQNFGY